MRKFCEPSLRCVKVAASVLCAAISACVFLLTITAVAQQPKTDKLSFDVASFRQNKTGLPPSGEMPGSNVPLGPGDVYAPTGGLLTVNNFPLISYISFAYRMNDGQRNAFEAASPGWVLHDRFDLKARAEKSDVSKDDLRLMMRSLLAERFGMAVHYEARVTSVFAMQLAKPGTPGPRLRPHLAESCSRAFDTSGADSNAPPSEAVDGGFPSVCGGLLMLPDSTPGHFHIGARDVPVTLISNALSSWGDLGRPVVDATGLVGHYDFALDFTPKRADPMPDAGGPAEADEPNFLEAIRKQLGLKLESQKQSIQVLVLDHIDHINEN